jgi:hypothetical protein
VWQEKRRKIMRLKKRYPHMGVSNQSGWLVAVCSRLSKHFGEHRHPHLPAHRSAAASAAKRRNRQSEPSAKRTGRPSGLQNTSSKRAERPNSARGVLRPQPPSARMPGLRRLRQGPPRHERNSHEQHSHKQDSQHHHWRTGGELSALLQSPKNADRRKAHAQQDSKNSVLGTP